MPLRGGTCPRLLDVRPSACKAKTNEGQRKKAKGALLAREGVGGAERGGVGGVGGDELDDDGGGRSGSFVAGPLHEPVGEAAESDGVGAGDHLVIGERVAERVGEVGIPGARGLRGGGVGSGGLKEFGAEFAEGLDASIIGGAEVEVEEESGVAAGVDADAGERADDDLGGRAGFNARGLDERGRGVGLADGDA